MKQKIRKIRDNRGTIMLEAMIVYPITMFLLFFVLAVFSVLFQRWNMQTIANESVTRMAQTYRLATADESTGFVEEDYLYGKGPYRYTANVFTHSMEESIQERVATYADWRLANTTYTKNVTEPICKVEVIPDAMGRRHLELTITGEYAVPFGEALSYFGFNSTITYEVSAYADCVDIIDYLNLIDYINSQTQSGLLNSKVVGFIDSALSLFDNIFNDDNDASSTAPGSSDGGFRDSDDITPGSEDGGFR